MVWFSLTCKKGIKTVIRDPKGIDQVIEKGGLFN